MRRTDIRFGRKYKVGDSWGRGPAEVLGPERRAPGSPFSNQVEFLVRFPMAKPGVRNEQWFPARAFKHRWGEEDQRQFEAERRRSAEVEAIKTGLTAAGFKPSQLHTMHTDDDIWLGFRGETAEAVVRALLQSAGVEIGTRELTEAAKQLGQG